MKKSLKLFYVFMLVCFSAVLLSVTAFAENEINLQLKKKADSIILQWNGNKKETYSVYKKAGKGKFSVVGKVKGKKYTDKSLVGGEKYTYCVKLTKSKKIKSAQKTVVYLPAPVMRSAQISDAGIKVRWKITEGAEAYTVYRKAAGGKSVFIGKTEKTELTDNTAVTGTVYTYTVRSVRDKNKSTASSVQAGILASPVLKALERSPDGMLLSWEKTSGAQSYTVYRRVSEKDKWKKAGTVGSDCLIFEDKAAEDGVNYSYYVKAKAKNCSSLYENKFLSGLCIKAPEDFSVKKDGKKMKLTWEKKNDAEKYEIYKKTDNGKWKKLKETKDNFYTDTVKNTKKLFSYKVRAVTEKGKSAFSVVETNRSVDPSRPMVALTYDDGPHPVNTHRILDALEKHGARATFFVVGSRIADYSDCLKRQNKLGCEIANHSFSHASLGYNTDKKIREEVEKTDRLIEKYSGQKPVLVRAPGGSTGKGPKVTDKPFIQWSVDTLDWKTLSSSYVVNHIKNTVRDGSIILMHDLYGSTAAASEIIIPWLISQGYQLVTVSEMLEARGIKIEGGRVYYNAYA